MPFPLRQGWDSGYPPRAEIRRRAAHKRLDIGKRIAPGTSTKRNERRDRNLTQITAPSASAEEKGGRLPYGQKRAPRSRYAESCGGTARRGAEMPPRFGREGCATPYQKNSDPRPDGRGLEVSLGPVACHAGKTAHPSTPFFRANAPPPTVRKKRFPLRMRKKDGKGDSPARCPVCLIRQLEKSGIWASACKKYGVEARPETASSLTRRVFSFAAKEARFCPNRTASPPRGRRRARGPSATSSLQGLDDALSPF